MNALDIGARKEEGKLRNNPEEPIALREQWDGGEEELPHGRCT
jgi:hypothetical protein